jgi:uncharacterized damage-inducible protein DinB
MSLSLSLTEFIEYTDWERGKWHDWLGKHGDDVLATSVGAHGDGRFQTIGDVVRHIFSAEKRYIDRLLNRPLTDTATIPSGTVEALFQFGSQSRSDLKEFVEKLPAEDWDILRDFNFINNSIRATPRKLIIHVQMHEIRHWAQIGTLLRLNGFECDFHDFLFSPVLGGEFKRVVS